MNHENPVIELFGHGWSSGFGSPGRAWTGANSGPLTSDRTTAPGASQVASGESKYSVNGVRLLLTGSSRSRKLRRPSKTTYVR
jgi:hypothetical protein